VRCVAQVSLHRTCDQWSIKRPQEVVGRGSGSDALLPAHGILGDLTVVVASVSLYVVLSQVLPHSGVHGAGMELEIFVYYLALFGKRDMSWASRFS
jgi:hypothetical protein